VREAHIVTVKPSTSYDWVIMESPEPYATLKLTGSAKRWHPDRTRAAVEPFVISVILRELERYGDILVGVGMHLDIKPAEAVA
jgi:hypothetical protein